MTVVAMTRRYHEFGWALRRIMGADNVRAGSQRELAQMLSQGGFKIGQQLISDYMRNKPDSDEPRVIPPLEFITAVIERFNLTDAQREDLVSSWLEILPEQRRAAILDICKTLSGSNHSSAAWEEMLSFERERRTRQGEQAEGGRTPGNSAP